MVNIKVKKIVPFIRFSPRYRVLVYGGSGGIGTFAIQVVLVPFSYVKLRHTKPHYWRQKVVKISLTLHLRFVVVVARVGR